MIKLDTQDMNRKIKYNSAFTLMEVALSLALLVTVWVAAVGVINSGKLSGSLAKHKAQAIQVMQRAVEDLRKRPFATIAGSTSAVSIDTKGTPDDYSDDLTGTQIITVSSPSQYYKKVAVELRWNELVLGTDKTMREYVATHIVNDPQAN